MAVIVKSVEHKACLTILRTDGMEGHEKYYIRADKAGLQTAARGSTVAQRI